jgi:hypothetical protein
MDELAGAVLVWVAGSIGRTRLRGVRTESHFGNEYPFLSVFMAPPSADYVRSKLGAVNSANQSSKDNQRASVSSKFVEQEADCSVGTEWFRGLPEIRWAMYHKLIQERFGAASDESKVGIEAEAPYTDLEWNAPTTQKVFEEQFQAPRALDAPLDFLNFSVREFSPARPNWRVVPQAVEKNFDLAQRESHLARKANEEHAVECVRRVPALATCTMGWREQSASFVVTDRGGV